MKTINQTATTTAEPMGVPALISLHYKMLRKNMYERAIRRTHDAEEAEELVQAAFIKALEFYEKHGWQATAGKNTADRLSAWLCQIVSNLFLDDCRKRERRQTDSVEEFSPYAVTERGLTLDKVNSTVIGERLRQVLSGQEYELLMMKASGCNCRDISEQTGVALWRVLSIVRLGESKVKKYFSRDDF